MEKKDNEKLQRIYKIIMLIAITVFITFIVTSIGMYSYFSGNLAASSTATAEVSDIATTLTKYRKIIDTYYLGDVDTEKLKDGAVEGYIKALGDKYTEYISAKDMEEYTSSLLGNFVGIGIYMIQNTEQDKIQVLSPITDGPAEKAGILPGDLIVSADGVEYKANDVTIAATNIKGTAGTTVHLKILRDGQMMEFDIVREKVNLNPIETEVLENNIGYMSMYSFDENTSLEFKEKFEELKSQNITSLIIDLRNNGGGLVDEAITIADYIVDKNSKLLITVDKNGKEEITKAEKDPIIKMPIAIIVNENTASASEILAGALQDLEKATIVGTTTYGKGVIQEFLTLTDGSGLKITTEEYYTPNKNKINGVGLKPNEEVSLPEGVSASNAIDKEKDTQLQKAIEVLKEKQ